MSALTTWLAAIAITLAVGACAARESLTDTAATPSTQAAQQQAAEQARFERAARAICREAYGDEALWFTTETGQLVCRRGGPAT